MLEKIWDKLNTFQDHHQVFFALIVISGIVCFSWGLERFLEEYVFPKKSLKSYIIAISFGLLIFLLTKHVILHVM